MNSIAMYVLVHIAEVPLTGQDAKGRRGAGSPLWRKAPLALLRYPGLLAAVVVGALLLSLVAAAYPLFLSRSEGELLAAEIANPTITPYGAGMFYSVTNVQFKERVPRGGDELLSDRLDEEFTRLAADGPHLARPVRYALGSVVDVTLPGGFRPSRARWPDGCSRAPPQLGTWRS